MEWDVIHSPCTHRHTNSTIHGPIPHVRNPDTSCESPELQENAKPATQKLVEKSEPPSYHTIIPLGKVPHHWVETPSSQLFLGKEGRKYTVFPMFCLFQGLPIRMVDMLPESEY